MTKTFRLILLSTYLIASTSFVMGQAGRRDPQLQQFIEAKPESWQRFESNKGRFAVLFPGTPKVSDEVITNVGLSVVVHKTQLRTFAEYGVIYADYPKSVTDNASADIMLDEGARGAVAEVNSQLLSISSFVLNGYPGRLLKERLPNGSILHVKMILVGQRMYQVAITTPQEYGADPATVGFYNSTASKFLDSFELIQTADSSTAEKGYGGCPPDVPTCVQVTEDILRSKATSLPEPSYPPIARAARVSGVVVVRILVNEEGSVIAAHCISGHPLLQAAAVAAARYARFTPTLVDNKPVKLIGTIQYRFSPE